jgi:hypothetical protein
VLGHGKVRRILRRIGLSSMPWHNDAIASVHRYAPISLRLCYDACAFAARLCSYAGTQLCLYASAHLCAYVRPRNVTNAWTVAAVAALADEVVDGNGLQPI